MTITTAPSYLRVLSLLEGDPSDARCLDAALTVARRTQAHMLAILPAVDPTVRLSWIAGTGGSVPADFVDALEKTMCERQDRARKAMAQARAAGGVSDADESTTFVEVRDFSIAAAMTTGYSAADVMVCAQPDSPSPEWREAFETTLIGARVPCIVARDMPIMSGRLALAWDGGGPARRALHAALPLIRSIGDVVVLHAPDKLSSRQREIAAPEDLCALLRRQGISVLLEPVMGDISDGADLVEAASGIHASLLICGAYGHSRAQQFFFGGATRSFLAAHGGPSLFMAH